MFIHFAGNYHSWVRKIQVRLKFSMDWYLNDLDLSGFEDYEQPSTSHGSSLRIITQPNRRKPAQVYWAAKSCFAHYDQTVESGSSTQRF